MHGRQIALIAAALATTGVVATGITVAASQPDDSRFEGVVIDKAGRAEVGVDASVAATTVMVPRTTVTPVTTTNDQPTAPHTPAQAEVTATTAPYRDESGAWVVDYPTRPEDPISTETAPAPAPPMPTLAPDPIAG